MAEFHYTCEQCGQSFTRTADRPYLYCGRDCYHKSRVGRDVSRSGPKMLDRTCQQCGTAFQSLSCAGARINYCSRWCQGLALSGRRVVNQLTVPQAAYIAGLIDGEGTVVVHDRRATRPGSSHPSILLGIVGTYLPMHEWLVQVVGTGTVSCQKAVKKLGVNSQKPCYNWRVSSIRAVQVLEQTIPYMVEKRARSERALRCFFEGYSAFDEPIAG